jgi:hypothetical protein
VISNDNNSRKPHEDDVIQSTPSVEDSLQCKVASHLHTTVSRDGKPSWHIFQDPLPEDAPDEVEAEGADESEESLGPVCGLCFRF